MEMGVVMQTKPQRSKLLHTPPHSSDSLYSTERPVQQQELFKESWKCTRTL